MKLNRASSQQFEFKQLHINISIHGFRESPHNKQKFCLCENCYRRKGETQSLGIKDKAKLIPEQSKPDKQIQHYPAGRSDHEKSNPAPLHTHASFCNSPACPRGAFLYRRHKNTVYHTGYLCFGSGLFFRADETKFCRCNKQCISMFRNLCI